MASGEVRYVKTVALCHSSCTTNERTWCTVASSHKPYGSRRARPRLFTVSLGFPSFLPLSDVSGFVLSNRVSVYLARYAFHMAFGWLLPFSRLLLFSLRYSALRLSFYLSIVHNYTIRLLNRLMRPLLPALAAPFTETTGRARASLRSLPLSYRQPPL